MTLGSRLKTLRGKRTQQDIADRLKISRARYSHYETDHVQPDNELLQKMAELYGVSTDFLLGRKLLEGEKLYPLSEEDFDLIEEFNSLNEEDKKYILEFISRLKKSST